MFVEFFLKVLLFVQKWVFALMRNVMCMLLMLCCVCVGRLEVSGKLKTKFRMAKHGKSGVTQQIFLPFPSFLRLGEVHGLELGRASKLCNLLRPRFALSFLSPRHMS